MSGIFTALDFAGETALASGEFKIIEVDHLNLGTYTRSSLCRLIQKFSRIPVFTWTSVQQYYLHSHSLLPSS